MPQSTSRKSASRHSTSGLSINRKRNQRRTEETRRIEQALHDALASARVDAYRYDKYSIRVRVVDESFDGKSRVQRERPVFRVLRALPEEIQADVTMLILLTPKEQKTSMMNLEFDNPSPSAL